ncbi:helix-turn-helix domain-containing protein [Vibrio algivorus]|uniref:Helix-turn-helix transcriptional regulator n=1 Tax=Vibrio algivorus TaxID=1667024 RepID=A0A557PEJ5_9VIBR|nr:helix-turn-helix transcriptional regulator [Vibrio algivorus]TVO39054.1 helix-turn-helix transcriptional regulator [Vibrio algivorus]
MDELNVVGRYVKILRVEQGLTQEQLAARCNLQGFDLSRGTLAKIESNIRQVTDIEVILLSRALNVKVAELFGEQPYILSR